MKINKQFIIDFLFQKLNKTGILSSFDKPYELDFLENAIIDSVEFFKFSLELEVEFDIHFSEDELLDKTFRYIEGLCEIILRKLS